MEIISTIVSIFVKIFDLFFKLFKEKRKYKDSIRKENNDIFQNRPEMQIIDFKNYLSRTGYGVKKVCNIDIFVAHIDKATPTGNEKNNVVYAHYRKEDFESKDWCCVIYTLQNAGKTDIS